MMENRILLVVCIMIFVATHVSSIGTNYFYLDIGNDTDIEISRNKDEFGPIQYDFTEYINRYVRGGCWCPGCIYDLTSRNCTVPIIFDAGVNGNLTFDEIKLNFSKSRILGEVGYGESFKLKGTTCWDIKYDESSPKMSGQVNLPPGTCDESFIYQDGEGPITTEYASSDAMFRLLNGTLDANMNGIVENMDGYNTENMTFKLQGEVGVQTLWGPTKMRLIVWS